jgi:hypothetical protein
VQKLEIPMLFPGTFKEVSYHCRHLNLWTWVGEGAMDHHPFPAMAMLIGPRASGYHDQSDELWGSVLTVFSY